MQRKKAIKTVLASTVSLLGVGLIILLTTFTASAASATFTVTNTNDSGGGSLRQAIIDANSNGNPADMDTIAFNIAGSEVHTITPTTALPLIAQKVNINGYTQPGSSANTAPSPLPINSVIKIEIDGKNVDGVTANRGEGSGIFFASGSNESELHGLSVFGFGGVDTSGTSLRNSNVGGLADNLKFQGSFLSVRADGLTMLSDGHNDGGVAIFDGSQALIGGVNPEDRNIIGSVSSRISGAAIIIDGNDIQTEVYGNYVGIGKDGETDLTPSQIQQNNFAPPYSMGISMTGGSPNGNNKIGGPSDAKTNVVSGGNAALVNSSNSGNMVQNNFIGTNWKGEVKSAITNGFGVTLALGSNNLIGGSGADEGNTIAGVSGSGVEISSFKSIPYSMDITPNNNAVLGNSIHSIGVLDLTGIGETNQGIDLAKVTDTNGDFSPDQYEERGPNPNDTGDTDDGPNGKINYPVIKSAQQIGDQIKITYDLDVAGSPSNEYRVEFFANNKRTIFGYGPGETLLGVVETTNSGSNLQATLSTNGDFTHKSLSATATAINTSTFSGFGSTSEFSQNILIASAVDKDADSVADSEEDAAPNNGDANADGTPDSEQPTITSYANKDGIYLTLVTDGCSENGTVSSLDGTSLTKQDSGYYYPFGLTDFKLNCSRGDEVSVQLFIHTDESVSALKARKYDQSTQQYFDLPGSVLAMVDVGNGKALKLSYLIKDGGEHDNDGEANGVIVDPVGLAAEGEDPNATVITPDKLAKTGISAILLTLIAGVVIAITIWTYFDYRKHKEPLLESDKTLKRHDANSYTYWHHLKVVSVPLAKYRLRIIFEEKNSVTT